jgi:ubiquinone/menaquinone biosynthesis C-methylase UbiE
LLRLVRCPDCHAPLLPGDAELRCGGCGLRFARNEVDHLVLQPSSAYDETTKFLEEGFHADGRDETVSPPLLSAAVRNTMLRKFLAPSPGEVVLDLGCGSGRFAVWNLDLGAHVVGIDTGSFFAVESRQSVDLLVGDLRRLPFADASIDKAYTIDVLEHFSEEGLLATLREVERVLVPGGSLFVYTHLRQRARLAPLLEAVGWIALALERLGLADLTIERLRKTDHLNPLGDRAHLDHVASATGFSISKFQGYTPVLSRVCENILVPVAAHAMARRVARRRDRAPSADAAKVDPAAMRAARTGAKRRIAEGGAVYRLLRAATRLLMLDVAVFGRLRTGPFFALFVKDGLAKTGAR